MKNIISSIASLMYLTSCKSKNPSTRFSIWFSFISFVSKTLVSDIVGEHWKRKSKSQPSIYMGGKIIFLLELFPSDSKIVGYVVTIAFPIVEFNWRNLTLVRRSCEWTIYVSKFGVCCMLLRNHTYFKYILTYFSHLIEAKMESLVYFYITSKSSNLITLLWWLVCRLFCPYSVLIGQSEDHVFRQLPARLLRHISSQTKWKKVDHETK